MTIESARKVVGFLMKKNVLITSLVLGGLITNCFAGNADITYFGLPNGYQKINSVNFSDVLSQGQSYWAKPAIYQIASMDIMSGFSTTSFSPTTAVTNEQAVTTLLNATGKSKEVNDMKMLVNNWSDKYIKYAMNNGLITEKIVYKKSDVKGDIEVLKKKGVFIRDNSITREEMATLIYRAFSLSANSTDETRKPVEFLDKSLIDESRVSHVDAVSMAGIMVGDESKMFNPTSILTRAELAQILRNSEDYLLNNLRITKHKGVIDSVSGSGITITDDNGNEIFINCTNLDVPIVRNNTLSGVSALRGSDEVEFFVNTSKQVVFIRVIDEGIYEDNYNETVNETVSKQGIVVGNSPYFYELSIKDKNGNVENYKYGKWTEVYKDNKKTGAQDILTGDTVYLEFDDIGDLVVIRGITNTKIAYGTITEIDGNTVTIKMDSDGSEKTYNLKKIPTYKNGLEINVNELYNGEYAKMYLADTGLTKVEIVIDERSAYNIYKGYISEINLIQDNIILRNPKVFNKDKWELIDPSFVTISLDKDMKVMFDGEEIEKEELGQRQVGKFAYIATREDTMLLEKAKTINIEFYEDDDTVTGEVKSYNKSTGALRIYDDSRRFYIDESTICIIDGKIVTNNSIEKGDDVSVTVYYDDGEYKVKFISDVEKPTNKVVDVYYGIINDVEKESEISIEILNRYSDDDWDIFKNKYTSFDITLNTRIYSETEPLNLREFDETFEGKLVSIVANGDEAVSIGVMDLGETPYISIGSIKEVTSNGGFTIQDVEYYDYEEEEFLEDADEAVTIGTNTLITKNGNFAREKDIEKDFEVVVIRASKDASAGVILITD